MGSAARVSAGMLASLFLAEVMLVMIEQFVATSPPERTTLVAAGVDNWGVSPDLLRPRADPIGPPTVAFMGDSFTRGWGVESQDAFPQLVSQSLDVHTLDHSLIGATFVEEALVFQGLTRHFSPDVVVWVFVLNDLGLDGLDDDWINRASRRPGLSRVLTRIRAAQFQQQRHAETERAYHEALSPEHNPAGMLVFEETLQAVVSDTTARGGRFVFVMFPLLHQLDPYPFDEEHGRLASIAQSAGAEVLDLAPVFVDRDPSSLWVSPADLHPNAQGHRIAAEAISRHLRSEATASSDSVSCDATLALDFRLQESVRASCLAPDDPAATLAVAEAIAHEHPVETALPWVLDLLVNHEGTEAATQAARLLRGHEPISR